jgi:hypothetical protein
MIWNLDVLTHWLVTVMLLNCRNYNASNDTCIALETRSYNTSNGSSGALKPRSFNTSSGAFEI